MNWRTIVGIILILGSVNEMYHVYLDNRNGKTDVSPIEMSITFALIVFGGCLLIRKGMQVDRNKMKK